MTKKLAGLHAFHPTHLGFAGFASIHGRTATLALFFLNAGSDLGGI